MKTLAEEIVPFVHAGFSALYCVSWEPERAVEELVGLCRREGWQAVTWDADRGLAFPTDPTRPAVEGSGHPMKGVKALHDVPAENDTPQVLILVGVQRFLEGESGPAAVLGQALANAVVRGKGRRCVYVVLAPAVSLPPELEKLFTVVEHRLPDAGQLREIVRELVVPESPTLDSYEEETLARSLRPEVVEAARGLTRREAEDAFALSLVEKGCLDPEVVWGIKARSIAKKSFMTVHRGGPGFESLGGLENLKGFSKLLLRPESPVPAKGLMLLGVPGTGKSRFCQALGAEVGRPVLLLDVGACYGKHVGDTEGAIRSALATADAMGKCVLMIDEVEKGLSGLGSDGDSGVASRLFGTLLTWLSDREERGCETFCVCTSNDASKLPPEFARAERFDAVFFLDLPAKEERSVIWQMYGEQYRLEHSQQYGTPGFSDEGWTGAEIKACCRLARALGVSLNAAANNVVPVSVTAAGKIKELREWASNRCLSASSPGVYRGPGKESELPPGVGKGRKINRPTREG